MKTVSVVAPCFNEENNVNELYDRVRKVFEDRDRYELEFIFIDNASTDGTLRLLRELAARDRRVKVIVNTRNFGHVRSPYHALLQARGDAVIGMASDLQDPPEMIPQFLEKWEQGYKIAIAIKTQSEESAAFFAVRRMYYGIISRLADFKLARNFTGFGLYDRVVIERLRLIDDPYPYFRGLICDLGYERAEVEFLQARRTRGVTKNNLYTLYDVAMLGITNYSKVPLRLATMLGFVVATLSLMVALAYLAYKLVMWDSFQVGMAPLVIGLFFFSSVQLFFIGMLGEYIGAIHTQVLKRPLVIERERINFDEGPRQSATIGLGCGTRCRLDRGRSWA